MAKNAKAKINGKKIKLAIAGIGNCCSSLVQGITYYKNVKSDDELVPGLMHNVVGEYGPGDIQIVAAFDVDKRKVGKDVADAIFELPNCTKVFCKDIKKTGVKVQMGNILDGIANHMKDYPEDKTFSPSDKKPADIAGELKRNGAEVLINYMPVGSQKATEFYAKAAMEAGCGFVNCMPVFIVSDKEWGERFAKAGIPCIGDDIKSQVGATIVHRTLSHLFAQRGVIIDRSYQLNFGGNSVTGDQMIMLKKDGKIKYAPIGDFIDGLMKKYKPEITVDGKEIINKSAIKEKLECFTVKDDFQTVLSPVGAFIRHKITEDFYELDTDGGRKIKITGDHNVFVLGDNGGLVPLPAKDLQEDKSYIAVPENLFFSQKEKKFLDLAPFFESQKKTGNSPFKRINNGCFGIHNHPEIKIPVNFPITDEFLQIAGLWIADGSYDRNNGSFNIELACGNDPDCVKIIERFCKAMNLNFKTKGEKQVALRINSKTLGAIFKTAFGLQGDTYSKKIPSWVFDLSDRQIRQFIKGYLSGDGGITGKQIRWSSVSEKLIGDLQTLMLRVGVNSTVFKENYNSGTRKGYSSKLNYCWHGLITGYGDFSLFARNIGFIQKEKNAKLAKILKNKKSSLKEKLIPNIPSLRKIWKIKSTTWHRNPQISAQVVLKQIEKIKDVKIRKNIENLCHGSVKFLKVKKIRKIENRRGGYVYDLSVKGYERFVCSNILVHNTDFLNMLSRERLKSKKISKTESVESQLSKRLSYDNLHIGPSDWIPFLKDNKICFIRIEGRKFGNVPIELELRLSVEDSPNSAGVVIDAVRMVKLAKDRKIAGPLLSPSAYFMKHPPQQFTDEKAREMVEEFIQNKRER